MKFFVIILLSLLSTTIFASEKNCMESCDRYNDQCVQDSKNAMEEDSSYCTQRLGECYLVCKSM